MAPRLRQRKWPRQLYDYAERRLVDEEAAEIDVEGGAWVQCAICPRETVEMGTSFTIASWRKHQSTQQHKRAVSDRLGRAKQSPGGRRFEPRRKAPQDCTSDPAERDATVSLIQNMRSDAGFLALCYKGIQSKEREREKFEADVHSVVNFMTTMLTEQQEEIDELHFALQKNINDLESIRADMRALRRRSGQDSTLVRTDKRRTPLGSKRKSASDPFGWNGTDGNDDGTRRTLHMSQYT